MAAFIIPNSTAPPWYPMVRMLADPGIPPYNIGAPGWVNCPMVNPTSSSACSCARVPAMVMGEVDPAMGAEESATGIPCLQASCMFRVDWVQSFNGLMAKQVINEKIGFSASFFLPPATMDASANISLKDWRSMAPVI